MKETADEAVAQAPTVEHVLVFRRAGRREVPWTPGVTSGGTRLVDGQAPSARPSGPTPKTHT